MRHARPAFRPVLLPEPCCTSAVAVGKGRSVVNCKRSRRGHAVPVSASALPPDTRVPVTIITGFLGSGKTTLLNHILTQPHGRRIAVIENEFGEIDIDSELVARQEVLDGTQVTTLNNGCLCCTMREDLVKVLNKLYTRRQDFDHIIIETTGLADPGPVISSFYLDTELPFRMRIDGVVTVVDAVNVDRRLNEEKPEGVVNEAVAQIAYADRVVLNKVDLVDSAALSRVTKRVGGINRLAGVQRAARGVVPVDFVLGVGGFDLDKVEGQVTAAQAPPAASHDHPHHHDHQHDHECAPGCTHESHSHGHAHEHHEHEHNQHHDHNHEQGRRGLVTETKHDDAVSSISIAVEGEMDIEKINYTMGMLLEARGEDLYRMKGILAIKNEPYRYVYQSVHMLFEGGPERLWREEEKRLCRMVFIGRQLDRAAFEQAFRSCLVDAPAPLTPAAAGRS